MEFPCYFVAKLISGYSLKNFDKLATGIDDLAIKNFNQSQK